MVFLDGSFNQYCFRHCGNKSILVIVDYTIKARQINLNRIIYVTDVELLDEGEIKNYWCIRFLVPISKTCSMSFHDFFRNIHLKMSSIETAGTGPK